MVLDLKQDVTYRIIGCAMAVHSQLGPGLREGIYQRALAAKMEEAGLIHEEEKYVQIVIDGNLVGLLYLDHLVEGSGSIVVELKALKHRITDIEIGQVITYLAATGHAVGLLINFGGRSLELRRILPPRKLEVWKKLVGRYVWRPPANG